MIMFKRIAQLAVFSSVVIIVWAAVLAPVVAGSFWTTKEYSNVEQSAYYMEDIFNMKDGVYSYSYSTSTRDLTLSDGVINVPSSRYTLVTFGAALFRSDNDFSATLEINGDVRTFTYYRAGADPLVYTITNELDHAYIISNSPTDYVMMKLDNTGTYFNKNCPVYFSGTTFIGGVYHAFRMNVSPNDTVFLDAVPATTELNNIVTHFTKVSGVNNAYILQNLTFDATPSGGSTQECVYSYGVAHAIVKGTNPSDLAPIGSIIPLIALIGVVLAVVRVAINARE